MQNDAKQRLFTRLGLFVLFAILILLIILSWSGYRNKDFPHWFLLAFSILISIVGMLGKSAGKPEISKYFIFFGWIGALLSFIWLVPNIIELAKFPEQQFSKDMFRFVIRREFFENPSCFDYNKRNKPILKIRSGFQYEYPLLPLDRFRKKDKKNENRNKNYKDYYFDFNYFGDRINKDIKSSRKSKKNSVRRKILSCFRSISEVKSKVMDARTAPHYEVSDKRKKLYIKLQELISDAASLSRVIRNKYNMVNANKAKPQNAIFFNACLGGIYDGIGDILFEIEPFSCKSDEFPQLKSYFNERQERMFYKDAIAFYQEADGLAREYTTKSEQKTFFCRIYLPSAWICLKIGDHSLAEKYIIKWMCWSNYSKGNPDPKQFPKSTKELITNSDYYKENEHYEIIRILALLQRILNNWNVEYSSFNELSLLEWRDLLCDLDGSEDASKIEIRELIYKKPTTKKTFRKLKSRAFIENKDKALICRELNKILQSEDLYKKHKKHKKDKKDLIKFNRSLIESIFPKEIAKSHLPINLADIMIHDRLRQHYADKNVIPSDIRKRKDKLEETVPWMKLRCQRLRGREGIRITIDEEVRLKAESLTSSDVAMIFTPQCIRGEKQNIKISHRSVRLKSDDLGMENQYDSAESDDKFVVLKNPQQNSSSRVHARTQVAFELRHIMDIEINPKLDSINKFEIDIGTPAGNKTDVYWIPTKDFISRPIRKSTKQEPPNVILGSRKNLYIYPKGGELEKSRAAFIMFSILFIIPILIIHWEVKGIIFNFRYILCPVFIIISFIIYCGYYYLSIKGYATDTKTWDLANFICNALPVFFLLFVFYQLGLLMTRINIILCGSSLFSMEDILKWSEFLISLKNPTKKTGNIRIYNLLEKKEKKIINAWNIGTTISDEDKNTIIDGLNKVLKTQDFHDQQNFTGINLPEEGQKLQKKGLKNLDSKEIQRFNRLLFESIYPHCIKNQSTLQSFSSSYVWFAVFELSIILLLLVLHVGAFQHHYSSIPLYIMNILVLLVATAISFSSINMLSGRKFAAYLFIYYMSVGVLALSRLESFLDVLRSPIGYLSGSSLYEINPIHVLLYFILMVIFPLLILRIYAVKPNAKAIKNACDCHNFKGSGTFGKAFDAFYCTFLDKDSDFNLILAVLAIAIPLCFSVWQILQLIQIKP
ncbi:MAG: hypothetical protein K8T10_16040 [Candidatus Eremiobacteraeota bacterium]|nr:hypothetical protein [Candidatus Eremiobacteraeota bacterium]